MPLSIAIIGGGIGGLALAHGLMRDARRGIHHDLRVQVYERDTTASSRGQGYLLGLNPDGVRSLLACCDGEPDVLESLGALFGPESVQGFAMCDQNFGTLLATPPATSTCAGIYYGKKFDSYELLDAGEGDGGEGEPHVRIRFTDGSTAEADILVGADGARSRTRPLRCPGLRLAPVGVMNLAGHVPFDTSTAAAATAFPKIHAAVFGSGQLPRRPPFLVRAYSPAGVAALLLPFKDDRGNMNLIVAMTFAAPARDADAYMAAAGLDPAAADLRQRVKDVCVAKAAEAGFARELVALLESMPATNVFDKFRNDLHAVVPMDRNPFAEGDPRSFGRVTLIGDALHAMTTHRGLGANTALMDATDLTDCVLATVAKLRGASQFDIAKAVTEVEPAIVKRGFANVRASTQATEMICKTGWAATVRNAMLRVIAVVAWICGY
ncbi:hypothetical protein DFJ73DRAFT_871645 [Zopfochytrium polystomum]|nr:hypothetical protein DFJ73DRAFT_871645 [Zopfochytrium polystomum]